MRLVYVVVVAVAACSSSSEPRPSEPAHPPGIVFLMDGDQLKFDAAVAERVDESGFVSKLPPIAEDDVEIFVRHAAPDAVFECEPGEVSMRIVDRRGNIPAWTTSGAASCTITIERFGTSEGDVISGVFDARLRQEPPDDPESKTVSIREGSFHLVVKKTEK